MGHLQRPIAVSGARQLCFGGRAEAVGGTANNEPNPNPAQIGLAYAKGGVTDKKGFLRLVASTVTWTSSRQTVSFLQTVQDLTLLITHLDLRKT